MQNSAAQSNLHPIQGSGDLSPINSVPTEPLGNVLAGHNELAETPGGEPEPTAKQLVVQSSNAGSQQHTLLPQRGMYYAAITGAIAGVLAGLLTIVITLVFAATFHAASQQIALDRLTVKTALALVGLVALTVVLNLLIGLSIGVIIGKIAVRRRLGFLAGALAGAIFYLATFLASLFASYPGNLVVNTRTTGSLVLSLLLLCLWCIGGGLVSLFGTWIATVRHPYYLKLGA